MTVQSGKLIGMQLGTKGRRLKRKSKSNCNYYDFAKMQSSPTKNATAE